MEWSSETAAPVLVSGALALVPPTDVGPGCIEQFECASQALSDLARCVAPNNGAVTVSMEGNCNEAGEDVVGPNTVTLTISALA